MLVQENFSMAGFSARKIHWRRVLVVPWRGGGCDHESRGQRFEFAFSGAIGVGRFKGGSYRCAGYWFSGVRVEHPQCKRYLVLEIMRINQNASEIYGVAVSDASRGIID